MKCNKDTIVRTVFLVISLLNQILTVMGKNPLPFSDQAVYQGISAVITTAASLWAWWKNNSFTREALAADRYLDLLRQGKAE